MRIVSVVLAAIVFVVFFPTAVAAGEPDLWNPHAVLDSSRVR